MADLTPEAQQGLAEMALALAHNKDTRKDFARLAKKAGLPYRFNDIEIEDAREAVSKIDETIDERLQAADRKRQAEQTTTRLNGQRFKLIKSDSNPDGRFTEEVVKTKLEPFMQERGISDYEDAATLFSHYHPETPAVPEIAAKGIWELPTGSWVSDPKGTARKMAYQAVADIQANRR